MTPAECTSCGNVLRKLISTRHKNILLRVLHGEICTKVRLNHFGLTDSNECPRCGQPEDLEHKFITCDNVKRIWDLTLNKTKKLKQLANPTSDRTEQILDTSCPSKLVLMMHAEILLRIFSLKESSNYLIHPKTFTKLALQFITRNEKARKIKMELEMLLLDKG